jgi:hypothetical protein
MITPLIVLVGADKGGVGKTTITRALLDYLYAQGIALRVFDSECPAGALNRFYPAAAIIDLSSVQDQMRIFDCPDLNAVTVVDIRAGLLSPTLRALDEAKLLDDVRSGAIKLAVIHVLGPTVASLSEIAETARLIGAAGTSHYLVKNHVADAQFFDWDPARAQAYFGRIDVPAIDVPRLTEIACETVEAAGTSFAAFARNEDARGSPANHSRMLRGYVRSWLDSVWAEFDRVGLNTLASRSIAKPVETSRVLIPDRQEKLPLRVARSDP